VLPDVGIDLDAVTQQLEDNGVEAFAKDYRKLLASIEEKKKTFTGSARVTR